MCTKLFDNICKPGFYFTTNWYSNEAVLDEFTLKESGKFSA